jgi:hypothetical protein
MPYQIITSKYFSNNWVQFIPTQGKTENVQNEEYESLGVFSQKTNWEKVFSLGDQINKELKMSEQEVIDEVSRFRTRKKSSK